MKLKRKHERTGALALEFAFVLPLFLLFFFALIDFGRSMMVVSLLTEAARDGCRAGIVPSASTTTVKSAVIAKAEKVGLPTPAIAVYVNGSAGEVSSASDQDEILVTATLSHSEISWLPFSRWFGGNLSGRYALPKE